MVSSWGLAAAAILLAPAVQSHHAWVWPRRERPADEELLRGLAAMVMRIDAKLDHVIELLGGDDGEEEVDA